MLKNGSCTKLPAGGFGVVYEEPFDVNNPELTPKDIPGITNLRASLGALGLKVIQPCE
tara:strand:- start:134 stop:307 length:174 start_codon:yes stop_codon:yes gene_type:complete